MDRELDPHFLRQRRVRRVVLSTLSAAALTLVFVAVPRWLRPSVDGRTLRYGAVDRGPVEATLEAAGTVVPAFEAAISTPVDARVLRVVRRSGAMVAAGDEILTLDTAPARLELDRLEDRLAQKHHQRDLVQLDLASSLQELDSQIAQRRLDAEILRTRHQQNLELARGGLVSDQTLRQSAVEAEKAAIGLSQLEAAVDVRRRRSAVEARGVDLDVAILTKERDQAARQLEQATTRADRAGVVTWVIDDEGSTVRQGDVVARIADLSSFRVEATVSDVHAARLTPGSPAHVRLDGELLPARVAAVDPTIQNGIVRFTVEFAEAALARHPKLRNSLRVEVLVVTAVNPHTVRAPAGRYAAGGARVPVYVLTPGAGPTRVAQRREARFGLAGTDHVEVLDGLAPGEVLILSDLTDFASAPRVTLRNVPEETR